PGERVECAERLVHQQDRRVHRVRAGDGAALLHAARERLGQCVGEIGESDHVDEMLSSPTTLLGRSFGGLEPELDVLADREPGEQSVLLEDDAAFGTGSVDLPTIDERSSSGRFVEAGQDVHQGGLPAARGTDTVMNSFSSTFRLTSPSASKRSLPSTNVLLMFWTWILWSLIADTFARWFIGAPAKRSASTRSSAGCGP